jgi:chemotaxis receptor (MCP) glutamine deamidase CheD
MSRRSCWIGGMSRLSEVGCGCCVSVVILLPSETVSKLVHMVGFRLDRGDSSPGSSASGYGK